MNDVLNIEESVLLGLAGDSWSGRVLHLDPIRASPGATTSRFDTVPSQQSAQACLNDHIITGVVLIERNSVRQLRATCA